MEEKDLFAPPTEKELKEIDLFAPPTKDEIAILNLKDIGSGAVGAGKNILEAISDVADYPFGIMRTAYDAAADVATGKSGIPAAASKVLESATDPSTAVTGKKLAQRMGISDKPMGNEYFKPFGDIPQSDLAGTAIDVGLGGITSAIAGSAAKLPAVAARSILGGDEAAIRAVGLRRKDIETGIRTASYGDEIKNVEKISDYAKKNILKPFDETADVLNKTKIKLESVGDKIGKIRKEASDEVTKYLTKNAGKPELQDYLNNVFTPRLSYGRIKTAIDREIPDPEYANKVLSIIENKLGFLQDRYGNQDIPIDVLTRLKATWQREITSGREAADYVAREDAFKYLSKDLNNAIDNELNLYDKVYSGKLLSEHSKLKKEYGILSLMNDSLSNRLAKEITATGPMTLNPLEGFRTSTGLQAAVATGLPENIAVGPKTIGTGAGILGAGRILNMKAGDTKEPTYEGFPRSQTFQLTPIELPGAKVEIENSSLGSVEKAKRLNLLNKYGRIYIGQ